MAISRFENFISVYLHHMDVVGEGLRARVLELLKARPDLEQAQFFQAIRRPTASWQSEFVNGKRTTNDLRLVIKIAKVFGVSVAYLLGEEDRPMDPGAATLVATWDVLNDRDKKTLLRVAASFRPNDASDDTPADAGEAEAPRKGAGRATTPKRKR